MSLIQSARKYIGVKFRHRGRTRSGLDCAGLVWKAYQDCGVELPDFRLYSTEPSSHGPGLTNYVEHALGSPVHVAPVKESDLMLEDVLVMRFAKEPHHVGLVGRHPTGALSLIHADGHTGRVLEHRLSEDIIRRITHVFRKAI